MITELNRKSLSIGVPGLVLQTVSYFVHESLHAPSPSAEWMHWATLAGLVVGTVLLIIGCCYYAKAKGYPAVVGLLGSLSCLGWLILGVLPDLEKRSARRATESDGSVLLQEALRLEVNGDTAGALLKYQQVANQLPGTEAATDAEASIRSLQSKIGKGVTFNLSA